jgi:very-short-patch-repair endonuclease
MMEMAQAQQGSSTAVDPLLQDRASGEIRVLIELDHRAQDASKDRDRDCITAADGYPTVRLSARMRPSRTSVAAAVALTLT